MTDNQANGLLPVFSPARAREIIEIAAIGAVFSVSLRDRPANVVVIEYCEDYSHWSPSKKARLQRRARQTAVREIRKVRADMSLVIGEMQKAHDFCGANTLMTGIFLGEKA